MKILYFGTVCDLEGYENKLLKCKFKPTIAPIVFETALLKGIIQNGVDIEIHSFPMIPTFPKSQFLYFGGHSEELPFGKRCHWLNTINVPLFKQWSRCKDAKRIMKKWIKDNGKEGVIMTYSIPPFLVKDLVKYGKKYSVKTVAIVPDLLCNMYINYKGNNLFKIIKNCYLKNALNYQGKYDAYIYLTEAMRNMVAPNKKYIVMEGIYDHETVLFDQDRISSEKASPRVIMYAGRLHEKYGTLRLIEAFERLRDEGFTAELWLFGDGTAVDIIRKKANENCCIKYFGRISHEEILKYEEKASLLVNLRDPSEEFTKYSFPSKTIEYMSSGTPLLTTKLQGIPEEYFQYVYIVEDNDVATLCKTMKEILSLTDSELELKGKQSQDFIKRNKNVYVQGSRIIDFLENLHDA